MMWRYFICMLCGILLPFMSHGQNAEVFVSDDQIAVNDVVLITIKIRDIKSEKINPLAFNHFRIVDGPRFTSYYTSVNGRVDSGVEVQYKLLAEKPGIISLPSSPIVVDGKSFPFTPKKIEILQRSQSSALGKDIFIKASLNKDTGFVHEQFVITYDLYYATDIDRISVLREHDYEKGDYHRFDVQSKSTQTTINGKKYKVQTIRKIGFFPENSGRDTIAPLIIQAEVNNGYTRDFFGFKVAKTKPETIISNTVTYYVKEKKNMGLPTGHYKINLLCDEYVTNTDNGLTVIATLKGPYDPLLQMELEITSDKEIQQFSPELLLDITKEENGILITEKRYEYLVIPQDTGTCFIQATFAHYTPRGDSVTTTSNSCRVDVKAGSYFGVDTLQTPDQLATEIGNKSNLWIWIIASASLLGISGLCFYMITQKQVPNEEKEKTQKLTYKSLKAELDSIEYKIHDHTSSPLLVTFLRDVGKLCGGLSKEKVYGRRELLIAMQQSLGNAEIEDWKALIARAEAHVYAMSSDGREILFQDIQKWFQNIQKYFS